MREALLHQTSSSPRRLKHHRKHLKKTAPPGQLSVHPQRLQRRPKQPKPLKKPRRRRQRASPQRHLVGESRRPRRQGLQNPHRRSLLRKNAPPTGASSTSTLTPTAFPTSMADRSPPRHLFDTRSPLVVMSSKYASPKVSASLSGSSRSPQGRPKVSFFQCRETGWGLETRGWILLSFPYLKSSRGFVMGL